MQPFVIRYPRLRWFGAVTKVSAVGIYCGVYSKWGFIDAGFFVSYFGILPFILTKMVISAALASIVSTSTDEFCSVVGLQKLTQRMKIMWPVD
ncbi:MAG: hypothetical protein VB032_01220 [Burkholderiaceae bacterium]|nr:hypothetical protein [Burkholderiaceae bacterium]